MGGLLAFSRVIDQVNTFIGKNVSWLILVAVLISAGNAVVRKAFDISSNAWLELQWYLYGTVFMLAAAYTLLVNEHVRIDVLASRFTKATRDRIELFCHVFFLLPFAAMMVWLSYPWVVRSISSGEISANAGGLVLWPAKAMVLVGFLLLLFQSFSEIIKRYAVIKGLIEDPTPGHDLPPAVEAGLEIEHDDIERSEFEQGRRASGNQTKQND